MRSILFTASLLFLTIGCKKNNMGAPGTLPPITQTGANTFGCKINGKVWVPYFPCSIEFINCSELGFHITALDPKDTLYPLSFSFGGGRHEGNDDSYLTIASLPDSNYSITGRTGTVSQTGNYWDSVSVSYLDNTGFYFSSGYRTGYITSGASFIITKFDTTSRIISGTFNCTLYGGNDSASITDGRFDFKI